MVTNDPGMMIQLTWDEIHKYYPGVDTDEFIVMPNHIHGIITVGAGPRACPEMNGQPNMQPRRPPNGQPRDGIQKGQPQGGAPTTMSLPDIVHRYKTMTTKRYADGVKQNRWQPFPGKLWQRNYWEHIVRNENELDQIREYISNNPTQWEIDRLNVGENGHSPRICESQAHYGEEKWMI